MAKMSSNFSSFVVTSGPTITHGSVTMDVQNVLQDTTELGNAGVAEFTSARRPVGSFSGNGWADTAGGLDVFDELKAGVAKAAVLTLVTGLTFSGNILFENISVTAAVDQMIAVTFTARFTGAVTEDVTP